MRGYLHGGIIIDLIGQKGPTSKTYLVVMDLLVLILQCVMLAVHVERQTLAEAIQPGAPATAGLAALSRAGLLSTQDHDAEERGILRDATATSTGEIEMHTLASAASPLLNADANHTSDDGNREVFDEEQHRNGNDDENPLDIFYSGTSVIGEFNVLHTLRSQWGTAGSSFQRVRDEIETASRHRRLNAAGLRVQRGLDTLSA